DVVRHQVRGALDPVERPGHRVGQRLRCGRLRQTRHRLQQHVPAGEQAADQGGAQSLLADDPLVEHPADLTEQGGGALAVVIRDRRGRGRKVRGYGTGHDLPLGTGAFGTRSDYASHTWTTQPTSMGRTAHPSRRIRLEAWSTWLRRRRL